MRVFCFWAPTLIENWLKTTRLPKLNQPVFDPRWLWKSCMALND